MERWDAVKKLIGDNTKGPLEVQISSVNKQESVEILTQSTVRSSAEDPKMVSGAR